MEKRVISLPIQGIQRNSPDRNSVPGSCHEIINLRLKYNAWRPVGLKKDLYTITRMAEFAWIYKHPALTDELGDGHFVGEIDGNVVVVGDGDGSYGEVLLTYPIQSDSTTVGETAILVDHIGKILRVVTSFEDQYFYYLFRRDSDAGDYIPIRDLKLPRACFYNIPSDTGPLSTIPYDSQEEAEAGYVKKMNELRDSGFIEGSCLFMMAYRLFDGSFIMHSNPQYLYVGSANITTGYVKLLDTAPLLPGMFAMTNIEVGEAFVKFSISDDLQDILSEDYKGIINSLCIFMVRPRSNYIPNVYDGDNKFIRATNTKTIIEDGNYYLVKEITIDTLIANLDSSTDDSYKIDTSQIETLETNESLPVDNYSHHKIFGIKSMLYNQRLHMADVTTIFGKPQDMFLWIPDPYQIPIYGITMESDSAPTDLITLKFFISTDQGIRTVSFTSVTLPIYLDGSPPSVSYFCLPEIISYPDDRAYKCEVWRHDAGDNNDLLLRTLALTSHPLLNFAYYLNSEYAPHFPSNYPITMSFLAESGGTVTSYTNTETDFINDPNRIQICEQNNLWVNLAKHSYRIGSLENRVIGFGTSAEPVSEGQYGQFPIVVFTEHGTWTLEQGSADILYASIQSLSKDICNNPGSITGIGGGIVFSTVNGLKLITGRQITELSELVEGQIPVFMLANDDFLKYTQSIFIANLLEYVSTINFNAFLTTAIIAYDHEEEELIISNGTDNSTYEDNYSYVFSFRTKQWTKRTEFWSKFINNYPGYLGINGTTLYDMSVENTDDYVHTLVQTRPFIIAGGFSKIEKIILRGRFNPKTRTHMGALLFGTMTGKKYWLVSGTIYNGINIIEPAITRPGASYKYYVLVIIGQLNDSDFTNIDIMFSDHYSGKLR